ncbi:MAG TPA: glycogen debranching protein GlgX [Pilimelia sp.]|nr:glycogen debranching protein GlgX [Pilimelia sp.]
MTRRALIVATQTHRDPGLTDLPGAAADARELAAVLSDPEIGDYAVTTLLDRPTEEVRREIEGFFRSAGNDDQLLLHFSGHGKRAGPTNRLYLCTASTELAYLGATAIEADFVNDQMEQSPSRRILLLLDCCYSGSFAKGLRNRSGSDNAVTEFHGRGRYVITASTALQYAYEREVTSRRQDEPSLFTGAVLAGLRDARADRDGDGLISADELYDFVYDRVRAQTAAQTPTRANSQVEGRLIVAKSRPGSTSAEHTSPLPRQLLAATSADQWWMRRGAVAGLRELLHSSPAGEAAERALHRLTIDPVPEVADAARLALRRVGFDGSRPSTLGTVPLPVADPVQPVHRTVAGNADAVLGYDPEDPDSLNDLDSAPHVPKAVVVNPYFDWGTDRPPRVPWDLTVLYETHVKGMTAQHPAVSYEARGTFAGLAEPPVLAHLTALGVTSVLLMPVAMFTSPPELTTRGLSEYWGYRTIAPFAPHSAYSVTGDPVREFQAMVRTMHAAGLEVLVDLPLAYTGEDDHLGPTLSLRGIDNAAYYRLDPDDPRRYQDFTGAGNTISVRHPAVRQWVLDILRYWVQDMHVDGFRLPKAVALARDADEFDRLGGLLTAIVNDPVLQLAKVIVEPWDLGPYGTQTGHFPPTWRELNDDFRDCVRDLWRGRPGTAARFAARFLGSADLYQVTGRPPTVSVNYVTAHDGFTLADLVSYDRPYNEANLDDADPADERSWNCGTEGPTDDPAVRALRDRQRRNLLATLFLASGVPMLSHGDELGRTQAGNSNAYCQDNKLTWIDWDGADEQLRSFVAALATLRARHPLLRRRRYPTGLPVRRREEPLPDAAWFTATGTPIEDWEAVDTAAFMLYLDGFGNRDRGARGETQVDDSLLILFNPTSGEVAFTAPYPDADHHWSTVLSTATEPGGAQWTLHPWSLAVLAAPTAEPVG